MFPMAVSKLLQVPFEDLVSALTVDVLMARGRPLTWKELDNYNAN